MNQFFGCRLAAVLVTCLAGVAPAVVATRASALTAPGHSIFVFPQRDFFSSTVSPGDAMTARLLRSGVVIGTAHGTADGTGLFEVNHPGGVCWDNFTPDLLPGDTVELFTNGSATATDSHTVANVFATAAVQTGTNTIEVHGTAQDAIGNPLPIAQISQRMISKGGLFGNGRRTLRAPGDGALQYDLPGSINWTATYNLTAADMSLALASETRIMWLVGVTESTIYEVGVAGGPMPGCPAAATYAITSTSPGSINATNVLSGDLLVNGTASNATTVTVSLKSGATTISAAPVTLTPSANQTFTATFPMSAVATLPDGPVVASAAYTVITDPNTVPPTTANLSGATKTMIKDIVVPSPPVATPAPGTFTTAQSVSFDLPVGEDPASEIHFTRTNVAPTATSARYTLGTTISVTSTTTLRAVIVDPTGNLSDTACPDGCYSYVITVPTVAGAPVIGTATAGNGSATVGWTAPTTDGNSPITGYRVTASSSTVPAVSVLVGAAARTASVTGLINGATYQLDVVAVHAVGDGPSSGPSNAVTPATTPGTPVLDASPPSFTPTAASYVALVPARLLDTRTDPSSSTVDGGGLGAGLAAAGSVTEIQVTGRAGVPADAAAAALNVTVTEAQGGGFVTVFPCGSPRPTASTLNFVAGSTIPNGAIAKIGVNGKICLYANNATHLIADIAGYFPAND